MNKTRIEIENKAGFCPGVQRAIEIAEKELKKESELFCLGDIVHNPEEVKRLNRLGLRVIGREEFRQLKQARVMIRSHGEPPETYNIARNNQLELLDTTCKIVGNLQQKLKNAWDEVRKKDGQVVIFGNPGHPETIGLNGHINNKAIIIQEANDIANVNFKKPVRLFSQTTMNPSLYNEIIEECSRQALLKGSDFDYQASVCGWMAKRVDHLKNFANKQDSVIFVAGEKSSNGAFLFSILQNTNPRSYKISSPAQLNKEWVRYGKIGVSGATSTPKWQLAEVANSIEEIRNNVSEETQTE